MKLNYYLPKKLQGYFSTGLVLLLTGILFSSCLKSKNDDYVPLLSSVMTVNAYTESSAGIYFYVGSQRINSNSLLFSQNTDYISGIMEGSYLTFTKAVGDTIIAQGQASGEGYYSVFVADSSVLIKDEFITSSAGKAAIRFVNMGRQTGAVDVQLNSTSAFSDIDFREDTDFKEFAAGVVTEINVFAKGTTATPLATYSFTPVEGKSYTLYTRGIKDSPDQSKLLDIGIVDNTLAKE